jgi:hypothetical protein
MQQKPFNPMLAATAWGNFRTFEQGVFCRLARAKESRHHGWNLQPHQGKVVQLWVRVADLAVTRHRVSGGRDLSGPDFEKCQTADHLQTCAFKSTG